MAKTKINAEREHRIEMEVVVDAAYTEEERAMAWYRSGRTALVPFEAGIRNAMASSPLRPGEHVSITGLAHEDLCRVDIFV